MHRIWNGSWPENQAPALTGITLNGLTAMDAIEVEPETAYPAIVEAFDPER